MHISDFSQSVCMCSTCEDMKAQQFLGVQVVWILSNRVVKSLFSEFYYTTMYKVGKNSLYDKDIVKVKMASCSI